MRETAALGFLTIWAHAILAICRSRADASQSGMDKFLWM
jgi:hypothetical protein